MKTMKNLVVMSFINYLLSVRRNLYKDNQDNCIKREILLINIRKTLQINLIIQTLNDLFMEY